MREIINGIFYVMRAGCPWRLLPKDLPPWETIYRMLDVAYWPVADIKTRPLFGRYED